MNESISSPERRQERPLRAQPPPPDDPRAPPVDNRPRDLPRPRQPDSPDVRGPGVPAQPRQRPLRGQHQHVPHEDRAQAVEAPAVRPAARHPAAQRRHRREGPRGILQRPLLQLGHATVEEVRHGHRRVEEDRLRLLEEAEQAQETRDAAALYVREPGHCAHGECDHLVCFVDRKWDNLLCGILRTARLVECRGRAGRNNDFYNV